jgi:hypothetical protein
MSQRLCEKSFDRRNRLSHLSVAAWFAVVGQAVPPANRRCQRLLGLSGWLDKPKAHAWGSLSDVREIRIPSFCIRNCSVDLFIPSLAAAPSGPETTPFD